MRLRTTLVGVLVIIALVLSGTIYVGFAMHKDSVVTQQQGDVERTAAIVAERIDTRLNSKVETIGLWATRLGHGSADATNNFGALETFVNRTAFDRAETYDTNGVLRSIAGQDLNIQGNQRLILRNYSSNLFFQRARAGEIHVSRPRPSVTGEYLVQIAAPITDANGNVVGVFSGTFETGGGSLLAGIEDVGHPMDRVTVSAGHRTLFDEGELESDRISANATVPGQRWVVSVTRPQSAFADQLRAATALQVGGVAIGLLAVAIVGFWVSRTTLVRVRQLLDALSDLEAGQYRTTLDLGRIEEWRRMSERFTSVSRTLEQRDSQLRVLNRVLRHNLRNDMNVVTARAERVLADEELPPAIETDVEQIHATATRLVNTSEHARTLYEDLLDSPKQVAEPVEVTEVVRQQIEVLVSEYPRSTIEAELPDSAWVLDSNVTPIVIEETVRNGLLHNDLPESQRHVTVTVESVTEPLPEVDADRETRIEIADNGPGIPMVEEALLTDQLEETPIEHGSGLGVWLVNWLVDRIGGTVSVTTGVDRGTTVTLHLPAPEQPPESDGTGHDTSS